MPTLSLELAASIALRVYGTQSAEKLFEAQEDDETLGTNDAFSFDSQNIFSGKVGWLVLKAKSGFGYVAKGTGAYQGEVLLAFRGTATWRDLLTDANFGLQRGPRDGWVHGGFNDTFKSLETPLRQHLRGMNASRVHCVGHSLGGALATLASDWCVAHGVGQPSLYTFGSPRTGLSGLASSMTQHLQASEIHRVYQTADVVSMVPIFPFRHVPQPGDACAISWPGARISAEAHSMRDAYSRSVRSQSWATLHAAGTALRRPDVDRWLGSDTERSSLSGTSLYFINLALAEILSRSGQSLGVGLAGGATLIDRLAWLLTQAARMTTELCEQVQALLRKILQFVGRTVYRGSAITVVFVRWVVGLLLHTVWSIVRLALGAVHSASR